MQRICRVAMFALLGTLLHGLAKGEEPPPFPADPALESFVGQLLERALERSHVPGAVVAVVKDGRVAVVLGRGYADLERKTVVDAVRTRFRAGSVSKAVTALAALQLVEAGRVSLDTDVNAYLAGVRVPDAFGSTVTVRQLLTHTAGFEERLVHSAARSSDEILPLPSYLAKDLPSRVLPPGRVLLYSNQGFVLLGSIIESLTGLTFERALRERVLEPLEMKDSSFALSQPRDPLLAAGYEVRGSSAHRVEDAWLQIAPAAGLITTAPDMGRFMIALLEEGRFRERRVADPGTIRTMESVQFTAHPDVPGTCFGLFESFYFNRRQLYHPGGVRGYGALLYLYPEAHLGIFVADNGNDPDLGWLIVDPLLERFFPGTSRTPPLLPDAVSRYRRLEGAYRSVKYARSSLERVALLRGAALIVAARQDGALLIGGVPFAELEPGAFQEIGGYERAGFVQDGPGPAEYLYLGWQAFERVPWLERTYVVRPLLILFFVAFVWGSFLAPQDPPIHSARTLRLTYLAARIVAVLDLTFLMGFAVLFVRAGPGKLWTGWPGGIRLVLCLPLLSAALTLLVLGPLMGRVLASRNVVLAAKLRLAIFTAAAVGFVLFSRHWNMLGFKL